MSDKRRPSSFLGDLSRTSDEFVTLQLRRWKRLRWLSTALLIVVVFGTGGLLLGFLGSGKKHWPWLGAFWTLQCIFQIIMSRAYLRGFRRELDRRKQDGSSHIGG